MPPATIQFVQGLTQSVVRGPSLSAATELGELTLPGFLRAVTQRFAPREALVQRRTDGSVERWTYGQLWERCVEVAKALIACGIDKGGRVGVLMTNRAEFLSSVFGATLAGGVAVPLSTFSTPSELQYLLATAACSVLLLERRVLKKDFAQILCELEPAIEHAEPGQLSIASFPFLRYLSMVDSDERRGAMEGWQPFLQRGAEVPMAQLEARAASVVPADPAALFFSSGTTSRPKGILSAQRGIAVQLWRMGPQQGLAEGVRSWTPNGFFWSGNFAMVVGGTLGVGGSLVLQRIFQAEEALDLMQSERVSFPFAWPHQWAQLESAANWNTVDLSSLRYVGVDNPLARHPTVHTNWVEPRHCYGNTETFTISTGYPAGTSRDSAANSHGQPLPGMTLKIVDPLTGAVVPLGERGEIAIKGPTLMLGYVGVPLDETLDADGYFRTGDGGYLDAFGRLFWEGRLNDIIKTGGANVSPVEIDEVIRECPGVKLVKTVGVPHETLGEQVVSCIVLQEGESLSEQTVQNFARQRLASYKVPRRVLFVAEEELSLTGSAKVKAAELRALAARMLENQHNA
jgi:fatty-acyl-CoA synthase